MRIVHTFVFIQPVSPPADVLDAIIDDIFKHERDFSKDVCKVKKSSGKISFPLFVQVVGLLLKKYKQDGYDPQEEVILAAFKAFDPKLKGSISEEKVLQAFARLGEKVTPQQVEKLAEEAGMELDHHGKGKVDYNRLIRVLRSKRQQVLPPKD
jgi:Ca2+-binding EF-hand superfamily protein